MVLRINVFVLFMSICVSSSYGQITPLPSPNPVYRSDYGISSATDGQTLVVGAPGENSDAGAVYVFEPNDLGWDCVARLEASSVSPADEDFGYSVDVDGDTIVVGAKGYNTNQGAVYIFEKDPTNGWDVDPVRLVVSGGQAGDNFGYSVAIDGDTIVAGAYMVDDQKGATYVYEYSGSSWDFKIKLYDINGESTASGTATWGDRFGYSVSIDGDMIVIGSYYDDSATLLRPGSACVFRRSGGLWDINTQIKLTPDEPQEHACFGQTVVVSGDVIAIGSPSYDNETGISRGGVTVFRWDGESWIEAKTLVAPDYAGGSYFGERLSLDGDRLVVGEYHSGSWTGSAFLFEWDGYEWSDGRELIAGGSGDRVGSSVAISGDLVLVGAYRVDDGAVTDAGIVYMITLPGKIFNEFQVNTYTNADQKYPSIATDPNGNFIVAWHSEGQDSGTYGVYAQRFDSYGRRIGDEFQVNVSTEGTQSRANVAMNASGDFIVAWSGVDGSSEGIYARRYASNGTPLSGEFLVNTYTDSRQVYPTAALNDNGTFIVTWNSFHGNNDWRVAGRLYDATGNPITSEFDINQSGSGSGHSLAVSNTGDFTVVWSRPLSGYDICARQYNANGTPKGNEVVLFHTDMNNGLGSNIATNGSGDYVLTWYYMPSGGTLGVYAQRYDADMIPVGSQFMVNTTKASVRPTPDIAMNSKGEFVIVRYGDTGGSEDDVFVRRYDSNAQPVGVESQFNTYITGGQRTPVVVMQESGRFIGVWHSESQDGSDYGVFAAIGPKTYLGDFDFSGQVDIADLAMLAQGWLNDEPVLDIAPEGGDGTVNLLDFSVLTEQW